MMEQQITDGVKEALKAGDKLRLGTLRLIVSEMKNRKIADGVKELEDKTVIAVIKKMAKQRKESIEKFKEGGRDDLVEKETAELAILDEFLPEEMSEDAVAKIVDEVLSGIEGATAKDMGVVMKEVMARVAGQADGKLVSKIVKEKLC